MSSYVQKPHEVERKWYLVDATDKTLGRLSSKIASMLRGKHKPIFTPHVDCGDYVVVIHAEKVKVTGKKLEDKEYKRHSGYPGGLKTVTLEKMLEEKPEDVMIHAVKGMLPKGKLGRQMLKKVRVYKGAEHDHSAQKAEKLEI